MIIDKRVEIPEVSLETLYKQYVDFSDFSSASERVFEKGSKLFITFDNLVILTSISRKYASSEAIDIVTALSGKKSLEAIKDDLKTTWAKIQLFYRKIYNWLSMVGAKMKNLVKSAVARIVAWFSQLQKEFKPFSYKGLAIGTVGTRLTGIQNAISKAGIYTSTSSASEELKTAIDDPNLQSLYSAVNGFDAAVKTYTVESPDALKKLYDDVKLMVSGTDALYKNIQHVYLKSQEDLKQLQAKNDVRTAKAIQARTSAIMRAANAVFNKILRILVSIARRKSISSNEQPKTQKETNNE